MRKSITLLVLIAVVTGGLAWRMICLSRARREATFQGRTTRQWESEIGRWKVAASVWGNKFGCWTHWARETPVWLTWLEMAGIHFARDHSKLPLLEGDPAAMPVLVELLASADPKARQIAAQGLEAIGPKTRGAAPALAKALDDPDESVRRDAEQALFAVDRDAAEKAGLEWTILGLMRHRW